MEDAKKTAMQKKREFDELKDLIAEKEQDLERLKCLALEKEDAAYTAACQAMSATEKEVATKRLMQQIAAYCRALRMPRPQWEVAKNALLHQSVEQQLAYLKKLIAFYKERRAQQASAKRAKVAASGAICVDDTRED